MQMRRAIVYTLVVAALSSCAWYTALDPYRRLSVEPYMVPISAVVGSVFEIRARVGYGGCDENVHLELRAEGDTVVVIGLARNGGGVCNSNFVEAYLPLRLTAQPVPSMTIRFSRPDGSGTVRTVTVTPE
jgi:hypothetical protein